jgi:perosamine synthetase
LCALGISQIGRLDSMKESRRKVFAKYYESLSDIRDVNLPMERAYVTTNWHLYPIRVRTDLRKKIFSKFRENGVGVQVNYIPAYRHPVFSNLDINPVDFPNSESFYMSEISLPMWPGVLDLPEDYFQLCKDILKGSI